MPERNQNTHVGDGGAFRMGNAVYRLLSDPPMLPYCGIPREHTSEKYGPCSCKRQRGHPDCDDMKRGREKESWKVHTVQEWTLMSKVEEKEHCGEEVNPTVRTGSTTAMNARYCFFPHFLS